MVLPFVINHFYTSTEQSKVSVQTCMEPAYDIFAFEKMAVKRPATQTAISALHI